LVWGTCTDVVQAETFHTKPWFQADEKAHGYDGPLNIEPHDLAPISELLLKSMEDQGFPLVHDMFSNGETAHGCGHAPRTGEQVFSLVGSISSPPQCIKV
jgi:hypothetical protein